MTTSHPGLPGPELALSGAFPVSATLDALASRPWRLAVSASHRQGIVSTATPLPTSDGVFPGCLLSTVPPIVVDACILRDDILYACRNACRTVLVTAASEGVLRLCGAQHVLDEVFEHADVWATKAGVSPETFLTRWLVDYLPLIRVFQPTEVRSELLHPDEAARMTLLATQDPDDVPSATLALVLGAFYLTKDRTALRAVYGSGFDVAGHERWVDLLRAGSDVGQLAQMVALAASVLQGAAQALWDSTAGRRGRGTQFTVLGVLAGALVVWLWHASPETRERLRTMATRAFDLLADYQILKQAFLSAAAPVPDWDELAVTIPPDAALARACLSLLGRSGGSLHSAREVAQMLPDSLAVPRGEAKIRHALREFACFAEPLPGAFQAGHVARPVRRWLYLRDQAAAQCAERES